MNTQTKNHGAVKSSLPAGETNRFRRTRREGEMETKATKVYKLKLDAHTKKRRLLQRLDNSCNRENNTMRKTMTNVPVKLLEASFVKCVCVCVGGKT